MEIKKAKLIRCKVDVSDWFLREPKAKMKITSPTGNAITIYKNVFNLELTPLEKTLLVIAGECKDGKGIFTLGQMTMLFNLSKKSQYRFVLRNSQELIDDHGKDYYDLLIKSLTDYFLTEKITEYPYDGEIMLMVPSSFQNSEIDFQFIVHSKKFDVYNLDFLGSIG